MLKTHLKIAFRSLLRRKGFTTINVFGMAVAMAACLLILFYVLDELSYDDYHENARRIYRVSQEQIDSSGSSSIHGAMLDPPVGPLLEKEYPEIVQAARLTPVGPLLSYEDRHIDSGYCYWADPNLLDIFSIPFLAGNSETALVDPFSIVLSASKARVLFGAGVNPIEAVGRSIIVNNKEAFTVTGIFKDTPHNTHLPIDVLGSLATMESWFGKELTFWGSPNYATYVLLAEGASAELLAEKLPEFMARHRDEDTARHNVLHLQRVTDIHLHSNLVRELAPNGDIRYVYLLSVIALFILVIACINYISLATARSLWRAKEVGMRKSFGARRIELIRQFLGESTLLALLALVVSIGFVFIALPFFNAFTGKELGLGMQNVFYLTALLLGIVILVGVGAGSYPAFYLSAFRPAAALKGRYHQGGRRSLLRSTLVVTQFTIAMVLLVSTFVVYNQLNFVRNQKLGFNEEHVFILPTIWDLKEDFDPMREQLLRHPDILQVAQSNPAPSGRLSWSSEATVSQVGRSQLATTSLFPVFVDAHFFPTYEINLVAGRNFSREFASDSATGFVLNETAVSRLGFSSPAEVIDQQMSSGGLRGSIIGVVKDFHFESLHQQIAPMVFYMDPRNNRQVSIRIHPDANLAALVNFLEGKWQQYEPNSPLSYTFLDERFGATYATEQRLGKIFSIFAGLALIITCMGLLGMAAFSVEQRTKEIGVRKVLGASTGSVVALLSKEFGMLVVLAFVIATPVGYLAMRRWLDTFAYNASLPWWIFLAAGLTALGVAMLTLSYQTLRAALADPVKSLQVE